MNTLSKVKEIATKIIINDFSSKIVFHDFKHIKRVVKAAKKIGESENLSDEDLELVQITAWLTHIGMSQLEKLQEAKDPKDFFIQCKDCSKEITSAIFDKHKLPLEIKEKVIRLLEESNANFEGERSQLAKILKDAHIIDFTSKKGPKYSKRLYEQMLLVGILSVSTGDWYQLALSYMKGHKFETSYGKKELSPLFDRNYLAIEKEYKNIKKQQDFALQKKLSIDNEELKDLKKKLKASKGRDDRGIQTMFRTTSKNHYTLNEMVDRKANIMISVNSIILSIIIGGLVNVSNIESIGTVIPIFIMVTAGFFSMIFSIIAIRPDKTHGKFTTQEIHGKKGNLLFFGNFHSMAFEDYKWGVSEMLTDQEYLYNTMIRDIYYLGQILDKKYKALRASLNIFMVGVALSFTAFIVYRFVL